MVTPARPPAHPLRITKIPIGILALIQSVAVGGVGDVWGGSFTHADAIAFVEDFPLHDGWVVASSVDRCSPVGLEQFLAWVAAKMLDRILEHHHAHRVGSVVPPVGVDLLVQPSECDDVIRRAAVSITRK